MFFRVLKSFKGNGQIYERNVEVDIEPTRLVQGLISQRYLLPIDPVVVEAVQAPAAEVAAKSRRSTTRKD